MVQELGRITHEILRCISAFPIEIPENFPNISGSLQLLVVFMMIRDRPYDSRSSENDNTVGLTCCSVACFCIATL